MRYRIKVAGTMPVEAVVEVEAKNLEEAMERAIEAAETEAEWEPAGYVEDMWLVEQLKDNETH